MARQTNSEYPNVRPEWDAIYGRTQEGDRLVADHVASLSWDDLTAPASGINPPGAVSDPDIDTATGHLLFDKASTETIVVFFQLPHTYAEGTNVTPHVHWIKEATGVVVWQLEYKWYNISGAYPANYTTVTSSTVLTDYGEVSPAVNVHTISFFARAAGAGHTISSMFECKLSRLGGDAADDYDQDARFTEIDLHYLSYGHGSKDPGEREVDFTGLVGV